MTASTKGKRTAVIIACVLAALVVCSIVRDVAIKRAITLFGKRITGTSVELDAFSLSLLRQSVSIAGFRIHHPAGFEQGMLIDVPTASLDLDALNLFRGRLHIQSAAIHLKEMVLIRNREGKLNVDSLKIAQKNPQEGRKEQTQQSQKPQSKMPLTIDVLTLDLGKVVMKDYTKGAEPRVTVYDLNIKKTYKNIRSVEQLTALIMIEPMKSAGVTGAAIYGAAAVAGIGLLPAVAVIAVVSNDSVQREFVSRPDRVYAESLSLAQATGRIKKEDKAAGVIRASIYGTEMTITVAKKDRKTSVTVSARKYMMARPKEASGFLYQLAERLKEK